MEWLGEVPGHWNAVPIKYLGRLKGGAGFPHEKQGTEGAELSFHKVNALAQADSDGFLADSDNTIDRVTAKELGAFVFPADSIVFAKVGAALLLGRIRLLRYNACLDNNMMGLVVLQTEFQVKFVRHAMNLVRFDLIANPGAVPSLNEGQIGDFRLAMPPLSEQTQIAAFLDRETAKIDELVAEQRRLVELLKEKRQAVISHAVTKGLNPAVPMKDSGVEWLGEVPGHWELKATKRLFRLVAEPAPDDNDHELLSIYTAIGVRPRKELEAKGNKATTTDGYWLVQKGDLIVNKLLAWMGAIGISEYDGVTSPAYDILRQRIPLDPRFYDYLFRCGICFSEFRRWSRGIMDMRLRLYFDELGQLVMPYPPESEQREIVTFLQVELERFDTLTAEAQRAIDLLQEHRTTLISAAVTGQIDVRGVNV